jgi:hypothetical protein
VGFAHTEEKSTNVLPAAVDEFTGQWEISSSDSMAPTYDFLWNATLEEGREKQMISLAFTTGVDEVPAVKDDSSDGVRVAEAAVKVSKALLACGFHSLIESTDGLRNP